MQKRWQDTVSTALTIDQRCDNSYVDKPQVKKNNKKWCFIKGRYEGPTECDTNDCCHLLTDGDGLDIMIESYPWTSGHKYLESSEFQFA